MGYITGAVRRSAPGARSSLGTHSTGRNRFTAPQPLRPANDNFPSLPVPANDNVRSIVSKLPLGLRGRALRMFTMFLRVNPYLGRALAAYGIAQALAPAILPRPMVNPSYNKPLGAPDDTRGTPGVSNHKAWGRSLIGPTPYILLHQDIPGKVYVLPVQGEQPWITTIEYNHVSTGWGVNYNETYIYSSVDDFVVYWPQTWTRSYPNMDLIEWALPEAIPIGKVRTLPRNGPSRAMAQALQAYRSFPARNPESPLSLEPTRVGFHSYRSYVSPTATNAPPLSRTRPTGRRRPPPGRKERKARWLRVASAMVGATTELLDIGKLLYKSIPKKYRKKESSYYDEVVFTINNWDKIDWRVFEQKFLENELEDMLYGMVGRQTAKTARQYGRPVGYQTGPWDTVLSPDGSITIYGQD